MQLIVDKTESVPEPTTVAAGHTHGCSWDQKVWQDPSLPGTERFQSYVKLSSVPQGSYRLRLDHALAWEDAALHPRISTAYSPIFQIE